MTACAGDVGLVKLQDGSSDAGPVLDASDDPIGADATVLVADGRGIARPYIVACWPGVGCCGSFVVVGHSLG